MRSLAPVFCLGAALLLSSCAALPLGRAASAVLFPWAPVWTVPVQPPPGFIYTHYFAPLSTNMEKTAALATKTGKASTTFIRFFYPGLDVAFDDASIEQAARNGAITKIHYADYEYTMVLGIFGRFTTIVYGE